MPLKATARAKGSTIFADEAPATMLVEGSRWRVLFFNRSSISGELGEVGRLLIPSVFGIDVNGRAAEGERRLTKGIGNLPVIAEMIVALNALR